MGTETETPQLRMKPEADVYRYIAHKDVGLYIAIPSGSGKLDRRLDGVLAPVRAKYKSAYQVMASSALCRNCNKMWCHAMNLRPQGITHFLMLHDDILPQQDDWFEVMLAEMNQWSLKAISVISPIKDHRRTLSCGQMTPEGGNVNFTIENFGPPGTTRINDPGLPALIINTGLMLCDIRGSWCENVHFEMLDTIYRDQDGNWKTHFEPEDYRFARKLSLLGVPYGATNKVKAVHVGNYDWPNW